MVLVAALTSSECTPWSLITNICATHYGETQQGLSGCAHYVSLCGPKGTKVQQVGITLAPPFHSSYPLHMDDDWFNPQCTTQGVPSLVPTATGDTSSSVPHSPHHSSQLLRARHRSELGTGHSHWVPESSLHFAAIFYSSVHALVRWAV